MSDERQEVTAGEAAGVLLRASQRGLSSLWNRAKPLVSTGADLTGQRAAAAYQYLTTDTPIHKFNETLAIRREAEQGYNDAVNDLEAAHERASTQLDELGRLELEVMDHEIRRFVRAFKRIKNIEVVDVAPETAPERVTPQLDIDTFKFEIVDAGQALLAGGGTAAAVAAVSWTGVLGLATASTGTAISSLSGAAATNAALAWFGGGSIAGGGLGMSAGAMVLGGIVAAPAILAGGWVLDRKAATELEKARAAAAEAALQVETVRVATTAAEAVASRAADLHAALGRLRSILFGEVAFVELLVIREQDYLAYNDEERGRLMIATNLVKVTKDVMDTPLFDDEGALTDESATVVGRADRAVDELL